MLNPRFFTPVAYIVVGLISIMSGVFIASKVIRPSYSQSEVLPQTSPPVVADPATSGVVSTDTQNTAVEGAPAQVPTGSPAPAIDPVAMQSANVTLLEPYVFDTREGRRNPFRPPVIVDPGSPDMVLPGTPLERFELDELKVAAIMWDIKSPKAMIVDPKGEVHILGKDDRIGRRRGYVAAIREGEIVVVESSTFNGESTYSTRILRIDQRSAIK